MGRTVICGTFASLGSRNRILSPSSPASVLADHFPHDRPVRHTLSVRWGAAVLVPGLDAGWLSLSGRARSIALLVGLAALAILALLIASAAHRSRHRERSRRIDDEELFTTTPLPMPEEQLARLSREAPHDAFSGLRLPRWLQVASLVIALGTTWIVAQRMRPASGRAAPSDDTARVGGVRPGAADPVRDDPSDSAEDLDLAPDSAPPFSFRAQDWLARDGGCAGRLEVTKGEPRAWNLTARVHDDQGRLLDSVRTRVESLRKGDVVEFRFARAACERIGAWDVRGTRRD
jgi:hypothetical protein